MNSMSKPMTVEECCVLQERLDTGRHVADHDVLCLLATVASMRDEVSCLREGCEETAQTIRCDVCKKPASRWNGGEQAYFMRRGEMVEHPRYQFRCADCDPHHKWFDFDEAELRSHLGRQL